MNKKVYSFILLGLMLSSHSLNAQNTILFTQEQASEGSAISASSSSRTIYAADDFILTSDATLSKVVLNGAQVFQNLSSILKSVDFYIIEDDNLITEPGTQKVIYKSLQSMDGIKLNTQGYKQDFEIDLSNHSINLKADRKYWIIFSAYINAAYPSNLTDWHFYPAIKKEGTNLAKVYTNEKWTEQVTDLTFSIEGKTTLGTTEIFNSATTTLATTVVNQILEVKTPEFLSLSVYDLNGKNIMNSNKEINQVGFLTPGVYLAIITTKNGKRVSTKFIKK